MSWEYSQQRIISNTCLTRRYEKLNVTLQRATETVGWGFLLGLQGEPPHCRPIITKILPGFPAALSGQLEVGDVIGKIDEETTKGCDRSSMTSQCLGISPTPVPQNIQYSTVDSSSPPPQVNGKVSMNMELMRLKQDAVAEAPTLTVSIPLACIRQVFIFC
jgi:hypothetical protein